MPVDGRLGLNIWPFMHPIHPKLGALECRYKVIVGPSSAVGLSVRRSATRMQEELFMPIRIALLALMLTVFAGCQSNGLVVDTVNDYAGNRDLQYSHADGDGFINALMGPDSNNEWNLLARWKDHDVYDTDFIDSPLSGWDHDNFDQPGAAISFFSGHGELVPYGENPPHRCQHSSECTSPPMGIGRGICKAAGLPNHAQGDTSQCVYDNQRRLALNGDSQLYNNRANYSNGDAKWARVRPRAPGRARARMAARTSWCWMQAGEC